jgi:hypothetical protein
MMILVNSSDLSYLYGDGQVIKFAKKGQSSETSTKDMIRVKIADNMLYLFKVDGTFEPLYSSLRRFSRHTLMVEGLRTFNRLSSV